MRRLAALAGCSAIVAALAACGGEPAPEGSGAGLESVAVAGKVGEAPKVSWDGTLDVADSESETLVEGEGAPLEDGDLALVHLWIGNGFTTEVATSTYDSDKPQLVTVGPDLVPAVRQALEGSTPGSRIVVAAPPEDAFGDTGNPQLGIGNADDVLFVVDVLSGVLEEPQGTRRPPPEGMPTLVEEDGILTGWDFREARRPDGRLRSFRLVTGDGPRVAEGGTIAAKYLGQVFGGRKPFDENYSSVEPSTFTIGVGEVIAGWDRTLVGTPVGSRVAIVVPPELGYGEEGQPEGGIEGNATLYFVVDVLAAA